MPQPTVPQAFAGVPQHIAPNEIQGIQTSMCRACENVARAE